MISEAAIRNPQSAGYAALALSVATLESLVAAGVITEANARAIVSSATDELRSAGPTLIKGAADVLDEYVAPKFAEGG